MRREGERDFQKKREERDPERRQKAWALTTMNILTFILINPVTTTITGIPTLTL